MVKILFSLFILLSIRSYAYPEFIGYGYSSCVTCHFNSLGGGALNDYGRSVWASEIAARGFSNKSDEELAASSGFLGATPTPWWLKPSLKYRGLYGQRNPTSPNKTEKFYHMQIDANVALQLDPAGKYLFYYTYGFSPSQEDIGTNRIQNFISREYFIRIEPASTWWIYAGLLEKPFGIRNVDHTSYNRKYQNLTQRDQSLGVVLHKVDPAYEAALSVTAGNPEVTQELRRKGVTLWSEWEFSEFKRLGLSASADQDDFETKTMYALHHRQQISSGSGFLFEYGLIDKTTKSTSEKQIGSYNLLQALLKISRGYHIKTTIERYNATFSSDSPTRWKYSLGLLAFPMARYEFRFDAVHLRDITTTNVDEDSWELQGQIHVSL